MSGIEVLAQDPFDPVVYRILSKFKEELSKYEDKNPDSQIAAWLNAKNTTNHGFINMKNGDIVIASKSNNNSSITGPSVVLYKDNTIYVGNLLNSQRSGIGYRTFKGSSLVYYGEYANDQKSGRGRLYSLEGKKWVFEGQYANDVRNGHGNLQKLDGNIYYGNYVNDKMHGKGTLYYSTGKVAYDG